MRDYDVKIAKTIEKTKYLKWLISFIKSIILKIYISADYRSVFLLNNLDVPTKRARNQNVHFFYLIEFFQNPIVLWYKRNKERARKAI